MYLVADLGGGKIDVAGYAFELGRPKLVEVTAATGEMCGGSLMDDLFFKQVANPVFSTLSELMCFD